MSAWVLILASLQVGADTITIDVASALEQGLDVAPAIERSRYQAEAAMRVRYCEDAHAHLIYFSYPGRQYVRKGHSGEWTTVDTEERAALIAHWQNMVDELCD